MNERLCPGSSVHYTCRTTSLLRWRGTAFTGECPGSNITVNIDNFSSIQSCGHFETSNRILEDPLLPAGVGLESTLTFTALTNLSGTTIECNVPFLHNPVDVILSIIGEY